MWVARQANKCSLSKDQWERFQKKPMEQFYFGPTYSKAFTHSKEHHGKSCSSSLISNHICMASLRSMEECWPAKFIVSNLLLPKTLSWAGFPRTHYSAHTRDAAQLLWFFGDVRQSRSPSQRWKWPKRHQTPPATTLWLHPCEPPSIPTKTKEINVIQECHFQNPNL